MNVGVLAHRVVQQPFAAAVVIALVVVIVSLLRRSPVALQELRGRPLARIALWTVTSFALMAAAAPILAPPTSLRDPYLIPTTGFEIEPRPPDAFHPFGTTENQFDLYYGIAWGARTAFKVTLSIVGVSLVLGFVLGGVAGYYGGVIDEIVMRITDVFLAFPGLVLAVVIVAVLGKGLDKIILAIGAVNWPIYARLVRGEVLSLTGREFVTASRALGGSNLRIILRHVMPNAIYPFLVYGSLDMGNVVIVSAALSFLGLGTEIGYADWGQLIALSRKWILGAPGHAFVYWYTVVFPAVAITLFVLGWNILGDAIRDLADPRLRRPTAHRSRATLERLARLPGGAAGSGPPQIDRSPGSPRS
ncbi:MAG TPA: ABC transporter permease [bacterium]|nr:ABC transporter permease [bacterium]